MIYFIVFFAIVICIINYDAFYYKKRHKLFIIIIISLIVICGIRFRVGSDTIVYMDEYNTISHHIPDRYQIGWILLMKFFKMINASFYIVQFIIAAIINLGICRYINNQKRRYIFSGLLLYYSLLFPAWNFEILRQSICISIFLFALPFLKKRLSIYFLYICVASTIHEMSLILLIVPFLIKIQLNRFLLLCYASVIALIVVIAPFLKEQFIQLAITISFLQDRATYYYSQMDDTVTFSYIAYIFNILLNIVLPLGFIFMDKKNKRNNNEYYILCLLSIFTYTLSLMIPMIYRINYYFILFSLLLYIDIFHKIVCNVTKKRSLRQLLYVFILLLFVLVKGRIYLAKNDDGIPIYVHYLPYTNIFNEHKVQDRENLVVY